MGGSQAASHRRDLRYAPAGRVYLPDEVRLGGHEGGRRGAEEPSGLPARHHHRPRCATGTRGDRRPGERDKQDKAPLRRGLPGTEGDRVVGDSLPRIVVAGTYSGAGKTTVASGLMAALAARGYRVAPFKVGPDFIDPSYHALAAGRPGRNLDAFLSGPDLIGPLFAHGGRGADVAVVEGVMGLFDGKSGGGEFASTAHVAKLLRAPVLLVVDAAAMARSAAAMVHGYVTFDPELNLVGVILNRLGSREHERMLREAIAPLGIPVLGVLRRDAEISTPGRHLGLVPVAERRDEARAALDAAGATISRSCDIKGILRLAPPPRPLV